MRIADLRVEVIPGTGLVGRWSGVVLVLFGPRDAPGFERVFEIVAAGGDGRSLAFRLGSLLGETGPDGAPPFAVVADAQDGRVVVLAHGAAAVHATGPRVDETLAGTERPTWVDEYLPDGFDRVAVGPAGEEPAGSEALFDLAAGVVPGGGAVLVSFDAVAAPVVAVDEAEREAAPLPEAAVSESGDEPSFRRVLLGPITDDEAREPLPIIGEHEGLVEASRAESEGVIVEGVRCIRSHFNHPEARYCAQCGIGMVQRTYQLVRDVRPPLGILVFDDGTTLSLDATYVIGRDPARDDAVAGGQARPFVLEDPDQVLSRVHAEVRLSGWDVHLVDRNSANGTYVESADGEWERIAPGEPFTLQPGAKARVGRQEFVFDSHHRRD